MSRVSRAVAVAVAAAAVLLPTAPVVAGEDSPDCVTKREFRTVKRTWKAARVHRVFDTRGRLAYHSTDRANQRWSHVTRQYRTCNGAGGFVTIEFDADRRVVSKYRYRGNG